MSQMTVLGRGVWVKPEVSEAAVGLREGALETKVTAPTQHTVLTARLRTNAPTPSAQHDIEGLRKRQETSAAAVRHSSPVEVLLCAAAGFAAEN